MKDFPILSIFLPKHPIHYIYRFKNIVRIHKTIQILHIKSPHSVFDFVNRCIVVSLRAKRAQNTVGIIENVYLSILCIMYYIYCRTNSALLIIIVLL